MKKIISLFERNYGDGAQDVRNEVVPGAEWVIAGEGLATRKFDGTCCLVRDGKLYKRYEIKDGGKAPPSFEAACEVDKVTGKQQGWVPVEWSPENVWHLEAFTKPHFTSWGLPLSDGTYELCGPKVQGNPDWAFVEAEVGRGKHLLIPHGKHIIDAPRDFDGIKAYLATARIEGIVWHHPDGRMVKIKTKDFGLKRS